MDDPAVILRLLGVLEQLHEAKGVPKEKGLIDKNIIKSENSTFDSDKKVKSSLDSKQKKTLVETFTLFNKMFFDYQKNIAKAESAPVKSAKIKSTKNSSTTPVSKSVKTKSPKLPKVPPPLPKQYVVDNTKNDTKTTPSSPTNAKRVWVEKFNLFNKMFFDYKKKITPDKKEKTLVSKIARDQKKYQPQKPQEKAKPESSGFLKTLLGGLGILAGIFLLVKGLLTDGPWKGILKILSKISIKGGLQILKTGIKALGAFLGKFFKFPLKIIKNLGKGLFGNIIKSITSGIRVFISNVGKSIGGIVAKVLPKGGKGFFGKLASSILKILKPAAKLLKRIPIIGTLISVGFAISRFKNNDNVGAVIDVLSGLVGLLDLVVPGLGFGLSLGLDLLNAFLDVKAGGSSAEASKKKSTILMDMAKSVGKWIWDKRTHIPILSSVNRFMMAWDDFNAGNIASGFGNFGLALSNLVTGVDGKVIMDGVAGFMGLFESSGGSEKTPKPNKSFISEMSKVVGEKIKELWEWVKQKIKDGIAGLIPGGKAALDFAANTAKNTKELTGHITKKAKSAYDGAKSYYDDINKTYKNFTKKGADKLKSVIGGQTISYDKANKEFNEKSVKKLKTVKDSIWNYFKPKENKSKTPTVLAEANKKVEKEKVEKEKVKKESSPTEQLVKNSDEASLLLVRQGNRNSQWLNLLHTTSLEQVKLLGMVVNIGNSSLQELKRISGNKGGGSTNIVVPPQQSSKNSLVPIDNNRMGFASSPYSLS